MFSSCHEATKCMEPHLHKLITYFSEEINVVCDFLCKKKASGNDLLHSILVAIPQQNSQSLGKVSW